MDISRLLAEADPARDIPIPRADSPEARRALRRLTMTVPALRQPRGQLRRLGLAGAASAGIAAGVAIAMIMALGLPSGGGRAQEVPAGHRTVPVKFVPASSAARVLHNAALAALQVPASAPRPSQFVYSKVYTTDTTRSGGPGVIQEWKSVSGTRFGLIKGGYDMPANGDQISACVDGRYQQSPRAPRYLGSPPSRCTAPAFAGALPGLPTGDPAALMSYLEKNFQLLTGEPKTLAVQLVFLTDDLSTSYYLTPAQHAALYNLLAKMPGLRLVPKVRNLRGAAGVGVRTVSLWKGMHYTIIFDPRTYALLGMLYQPGSRQVGLRPGGSVLLKQEIVNEVGQLP